MCMGLTKLIMFRGGTKIVEHSINYILVNVIYNVGTPTHSGEQSTCLVRGALSLTMEEIKNGRNIIEAFVPRKSPFADKFFPIGLSIESSVTVSASQSDQLHSKFSNIGTDRRKGARGDAAAFG